MRWDQRMTSWMLCGGLCVVMVGTLTAVIVRDKQAAEEAATEATIEKFRERRELRRDRMALIEEAYAERYPGVELTIDRVWGNGKGRHIVSKDGRQEVVTFDVHFPNASPKRQVFVFLKGSTEVLRCSLDYLPESP